MDFASLEFSVELLNDKVQFSGSLRDLPPIIVDYTAPIGDGQGYTSLELFLMSLATCAGSSVLLLLRKMHKTITGCTVKAQGIRRDQHPTCFQRITLGFVLHSPDVTESDMQHALRLSEDAICPVWAMIKNNVEVIPVYRIIQTEARCFDNTPAAT